MVKKINQARQINNKTKQNLIFLFLAVITLYFKPNLTDPFNSPKQIILFFAATLFGSILIFDFFLNREVYRKYKILSILLLGFILSGLVSAVMTDVKFTAFIGEVYRKNGFLTYLALTIFFLFTVRFINFNAISLFYYTVLFVSFLSVTYGLMQHYGKDFVQWNNNYNSIIGTLGNPNFAGAVMGILLVLCISAAFNSNFSKTIRIIFLLSAVVLFITINFSNARQGIIIALVGTSIIVLEKIYQLKRFFGKILISFALLLLSVGLLGILQIGPLAEIIYKGSISVRGYYWRAGIKMFLNNPVFGVGFDRYGSNFKEYRDIGYPLNHGFEITSTNAHNTIIQLFATGGFLFGVFYLSLILYTIYCGIKGVKKFIGAHKNFYVGIFAAWVAFQAQSIISIDNIGISVWGWVLSGMVIGLYLNKSPIDDNFISKKNNSNISVLQPTISLFCLAIVLIFCSNLYKGESQSFQARVLYNPEVPAQMNIFNSLAENLVKRPLVEPFYKLDISNLYFRAGNFEKALEIVNKLIAYDPRNLDYLNSAAGYTEATKNYSAALEFRKKIAIYDPWNALNFLQMGRDYQQVDDKVNMGAMKNKIISFAPNTEVAKIALTEFQIVK